MGRNNALRLNPKFLFDCFLKTMLNGFGSKFALQTPNKFGLDTAQQDSDYEVCKLLRNVFFTHNQKAKKWSSV